MSKFEAFLGRPYISGRTDCYGLMRDYIREVYGLKLPNVARPERFWEDPRLDLYGSMYSKHGFVQVFDQPIELGDVLLMPIRTPMCSHAAIVVDDNLILHHLPWQVSTTDNLRPRWLSRATIVIRHPEIMAFHRKVQSSIQLHEVLNAHVLRHPGVQSRLAEVLEPGA